MSFLSMLDEPIAEVDVKFEIKPWHVILGVGGLGLIVWFFFLRKKGEGPAELILTPEEGPKAAKTEDCLKIGTQDKPLYKGDPLIEEIKKYQQKKWTVVRVPTGRKNVLSNRQEFAESVLWGCPPGQVPPGMRLRPSTLKPVMVGGCARLGLTKSFNDPLIHEAKERYEPAGWRIFAIPTGQWIAKGTKSQHEVQAVWACPAGK